MAIETDGTIKWQSPINEHIRSGITGSTTFDLNGDGKNEILYGDHCHLMIYDGTSGQVVYKTVSLSATSHENPVIADVDGDGHAEIIKPSNASAWENTLCPDKNNISGISVYKAPNNDWIGTRGIRSAHAYQITNISDSGAIVGFDKNAIWKKWLPSEHLLGFRNNLPMRPIRKVCQ